MVFSYKWMILFIFLFVFIFQIEASNKKNFLFIKDSKKKTENFFLRKCA